MGLSMDLEYTTNPKPFKECSLIPRADPPQIRVLFKKLSSIQMWDAGPFQVVLELWSIRMPA